MADTKITHLRNIMGPIVSYFKLLKYLKEEGDDINHDKISLLIAKSEHQCQKVMPEIIEIIKEIPNDAI